MRVGAQEQIFIQLDWVISGNLLLNRQLGRDLESFSSIQARFGSLLMGKFGRVLSRNQGPSQLGKDKNDSLEALLSHRMSNLINACEVGLTYVLLKLIMILRTLLVAVHSYKLYLGLRASKNSLACILACLSTLSSAREVLSPPSVPCS